MLGLGPEGGTGEPLGSIVRSIFKFISTDSSHPCIPDGDATNCERGRARDISGAKTITITTTMSTYIILLVHEEAISFLFSSLVGLEWSD